MTRMSRYCTRTTAMILEIMSRAISLADLFAILTNLDLSMIRTSIEFGERWMKCSGVFYGGGCRLLAYETLY
jgi:hypothetical protein